MVQEHLSNNEPRSELQSASAKFRRSIAPESLESLAVITYHSRSGSMFFQSLLDHHPQILMLPGTFIMTFHNWWDEKGCNSLPFEAITELFVTDFEVLFNIHAAHCPANGENPGKWVNFDSMGESRQEAVEADKEVFLEVLKSYFQNGGRPTRKYFFQVLHLAYAMAIGQELANLKDPLWIVFHLHAPDPDRAQKILEDFPSAVFFHCVREPVQALGSRLKQVMHPFNPTGGTTIEELLVRLEAHYHVGDALVPQCYDRSYAVKLEDLKTHPRETLLKVCEVMGIKWHDSLMNSTFGGLIWWNISSAQQIRGFDKTSINKQHEDLFTEFDRLRIRVIAQELNQAWNYEFCYWENEVEFLELLRIPFKLEKVIFQDEAGRQERNQRIAECFARIWIAIRSYRGAQRKVKLLSPF